MQVKNMRSSKGNKIANQFIIDDGNKRYFQSYKSIIALKDFKKGVVYLDSYYWDYSTTTGKYRNIFLNENINQTRQKIKNGVYKLTNLNK